MMAGGPLYGQLGSPQSTLFPALILSLGLISLGLASRKKQMDHDFPWKQCPSLGSNDELERPSRAKPGQPTSLHHHQPLVRN